MAAIGVAPKGARKPARVLVVDDHPIVRERLRELIESDPGLSVCAEAAAADEGAQLARKFLPDLVIADLTLQSSHGLDFIRSLAQDMPAVRVLVFSVHDDLLHAERVLHAGARGYLNKQQPTARLLDAIRTVLAGQIYVSESISARLAAKVAGRPRSHVRLSIDALTERELRVFELLGQGFGTRQIASLLKIEIRTVETYRARIKEKLQIRSGNELLQHAIRWGQAGARPVVSTGARG